MSLLTKTATKKEKNVRPQFNLSQPQKRNLTGWGFIIPAALIITLVSFYPIVRTFFLSLQTGRGTNLGWAEPLWFNYERLFSDSIFMLTMLNTFIYLIVQVPIMMVLALILANLLNNPNLKFKWFWRTAIFLPSAVSLVSYSLIFRTLFATDGLVSQVMMQLNLVSEPINWLGQPGTARAVIIIGMLWRWTGYDMIFYLAALQNIDPATIEAAKLDGAGPIRTFWSVTIPQIKPMIILTAIMSTNGTLQLFDETYNLTHGGPAYTTMSMSQYLYELSFQKNPNFGYGAAISYIILILVAVLAFIQLRIGDKRD